MIRGLHANLIMTGKTLLHHVGYKQAISRSAKIKVVYSTYRSIGCVRSFNKVVTSWQLQ